MRISSKTGTAGQLIYFRHPLAGLQHVVSGLKVEHFAHRRHRDSERKKFAGRLAGRRVCTFRLGLKIAVQPFLVVTSHFITFR